MDMRLLLAAGLTGIFARPALPAEESPPAGPRMVIVQPGYPGSTKDAEGFVRTLSGYLCEKAGLKDLSGEYHNEEKPALQAVEKLRPAFGIVSLGFYLAHRKDLGLKPLLESKPKDSFVLVARPGEVKDLSALKGQPVAGGPLHERALLERVVLAGKADPAAWDSKPVLHASRALRDLADRKRYLAVILTGRDYRALSPLYQTNRLEKILESEYYPPALLVAFGVKPGEAAPTALSEETVMKVSRALSDLSGDSRGKEILETMGAEGFAAIAPDWLKEVEGKYEAREKK